MLSATCTRGFGPFIAHSGAGVPLLGYNDAIYGTLACVFLIETTEAVDNIDKIVAVEGIDLVIPAQFDLLWLRAKTAQVQGWLDA